jgi:hypothetical protein
VSKSLVTKKVIGVCLTFTLSFIFNTSPAKASDNNDRDDDEVCTVEAGNHDELHMKSDSLSKASEIKIKDSKSDHDDADEDDDECSSDAPKQEPVKNQKKLPGAPLLPLVQSCSVDAAISWTTVVTKKGKPVDFYRVQYSADGGLTWTIYPTTTSLTTLTLTGLTSSSNYIFQVSAHNSYGWGAWSSSTANCTISASITNIASFTIDGLAVTDGSGNQTPRFSTFWIDYMDSTLVHSQPGVYSVTQMQSGSLTKNAFNFDLYIVLPKTNPLVTHTFTIDGFASTNYTYFSDATNMGSGNPSEVFPGAYQNHEVYAFKVAPGKTTLDIVFLS